jgi:hypothetical protein
MLGEDGMEFGQYILLKIPRDAIFFIPCNELEFKDFGAWTGRWQGKTVECGYYSRQNLKRSAVLKKNSQMRIICTHFGRNLSTSKTLYN